MIRYNDSTIFVISIQMIVLVPFDSIWLWNKLFMLLRVKRAIEQKKWSYCEVAQVGMHLELTMCWHNMILIRRWLRWSHCWYYKPWHIVVHLIACETMNFIFICWSFYLQFKNHMVKSDKTSVWGLRTWWIMMFTQESRSCMLAFPKSIVID